MPSLWGEWRQIAKVCGALAVASLLFNISLPWEMAGDLQTYSFVRKTISKMLSSGTAWAALAVFAGWVMGRARSGVAVVAGVFAVEGTLLVHYSLGMLLGIYESSELSSNVVWFVAGILLCGPLGLCGWIAARPSLMGLTARLVVPVGAMLEPFATAKFQHAYPQIPWPERYSDTVSGALLILIGAGLALFFLRQGSRRPIPQPPTQQSP